MRCFLCGFLGASTSCILFLLIAHMVTDFRTRAETSALLTVSRDAQHQIQQNNAHGHFPIGGEITLPTAMLPEISHPEEVRIEVSDSGVIFVKGGRAGQMFLLIPEHTADGIQWHCIGGSDEAMPLACRGGKDAIEALMRMLKQPPPATCPAIDAVSDSDTDTLSGETPS